MSIIREIKRQKALAYLKRVDYNALIEANNLIQKHVINEKRNPVSLTYEHHLPLVNEKESACDSSNWDLPDADKKKISDALEIFTNYRNAVYVAYGDMACLSHKSNRKFDRELLPPWIVFPLHNYMKLSGGYYDCKYYVEIHRYFRESQNDKEYEEYDKAYPMPEYMVEIQRPSEQLIPKEPQPEQKPDITETKCRCMYCGTEIVWINSNNPSDDGLHEIRDKYGENGSVCCSYCNTITRINRGFKGIIENPYEFDYRIHSMENALNELKEEREAVIDYYIRARNQRF